LSVCTRERLLENLFPPRGLVRRSTGARLWLRVEQMNNVGPSGPTKPKKI